MQRTVADRLSYGGLTLWETAGGPVSMAGATRAVAGQARIGPVYTPPERRGQGFGGAVTAAVSQAAKDAGVAEVLLYTDLANPTSNALYQRLGYEPVSDSVQLLFLPARPARGQGAVIADGSYSTVDRQVVGGPAGEAGVGHPVGAQRRDHLRGDPDPVDPAPDPVRPVCVVAVVAGRRLPGRAQHGGGVVQPAGPEHVTGGAVHPVPPPPLLVVVPFALVDQVLEPVHARVGVTGLVQLPPPGGGVTDPVGALPVPVRADQRGTRPPGPPGRARAATTISL